MQLFCNLELDTRAFGRAHQLDFETTFARELAWLVSPSERQHSTAV